MQRITSREGSSTARTGFSVLGSERRATTSLPPRRPGELSVTIRSSPGWTGAPEAQRNEHRKMMLAARCMQRRTFPISKFLAEIKAFSQRDGFQAFLYSIGSYVKREEEGDQKEGRQEHPPVRSEDVILLQRGEQTAPARHWLTDADSEKRQRDLSQDVLRDE